MEEEHRMAAERHHMEEVVHLMAAVAKAVGELAAVQHMEIRQPMAVELHMVE